MLTLYQFSRVIERQHRVLVEIAEEERRWFQNKLEQNTTKLDITRELHKNFYQKYLGSSQHTFCINGIEFLMT